jgi:nitrite reductase/ring-hydroxylating ferredoxin subunit
MKFSDAHLPPAGTVLCRLSDLSEPGAKGFVFGEASRRGEILVLRKHGKVHAYVNSCPHMGTPLDSFPDQFLDSSGRYLICSTHGARFEPESGLCVQGPCLGESLMRVPILLRDGCVVIDTAAPGSR